MTQTLTPGWVSNLGALSLEICFEFRISDFGFGREHPCKKLRCAGTPAPDLRTCCDGWVSVPGFEYK